MLFDPIARRAVLSYRAKEGAARKQDNVTVDV